MTRLNLVVEGQTEEAFVRELLARHLAQYHVSCVARCVETGREGRHIFRGGVTTYQKLKADLNRWMREDDNRDAHFSTMIDLYGLPSDFPQIDELEASTDYPNALEEAWRRDMGHPRDQFIPYLQVHEFEALLFADVDAFGLRFPGSYEAIRSLKAVGDEFASPEHIDRDNPPSKRIVACLEAYEKVVDGRAIATRIGLDTIREHCRHFDQWLSCLEGLGSG